MDRNNELLYVSKRFPAFQSRVEGLYSQSEEFQGICHDYYLCITSMHEWETKVENDQKCLREYRELKETLEKELSQFIERGFDKAN